MGARSTIRINWMKRRMFTLVTAIVMVSLCCCACQNSPDEHIITSKNNKGQKPNQEIAQDVQSTIPVQMENVFTSTDKSVTFTMDVDQQEMNITSMYEVVPHFLTGEDVRRAAIALFGEGSFMEAQPAFDMVYTKGEINQRIARWSPYTSSERVFELFGEERDTQEIVKKFLTEYTAMYETAPDTREETPCEWQFKKESFYYDSPEEVAEMDTSRDNDMIRATIRLGDIPYLINAETRNKDDYVLNYISAFLDGGISPDGIDERIFMAKLCRTEKPTEEQIQAVKAKAERILAEMDLGQWEVDQCFLEEKSVGTATEYIVQVTAVPVIEGEAVARSPQLSSYGDSMNSYASNYFLTDVSFSFSGSGDLISFRMYSPLDILRAEDVDEDVLSFDALMQKAQTYFTHSDRFQYNRNSILEFVEEEVNCRVCIYEAEYKLSRVRIPDTDYNYYYTPSLLLWGNVELVGNSSGNIYYSSTSPELLLTLNAVDGTVINNTNA